MSLAPLKKLLDVIRQLIVFTDKTFNHFLKRSFGLRQQALKGPEERV